MYSLQLPDYLPEDAVEKSDDKVCVVILYADNCQRSKLRDI